jgi:hypothetical protein
MTEGDLEKEVARAIWLAESSEGWDGEDTRMSHATGLLISPDYFEVAARAVISRLKSLGVIPAGRGRIEVRLEEL